MILPTLLFTRVSQGPDNATAKSNARVADLVRFLRNRSRQHLTMKLDILLAFQQGSLGHVIGRHYFDVCQRTWPAT
jgi:hypothetical protein